MTPTEYEQFFTLLEKIVNEGAPVSEKADKLKAAGAPSDITNVFEFASWWDVDEEDEDENGDEDTD